MHKMRVSLLQVRLNSRSPALNLQALSAAVDRAGAGRPGPDLLVLPGACDTGGAPLSGAHHAASLECVKELIAWKAREWGVFIAAGLHRRSGEDSAPHGVIFDPDGDIVARSGK